MALLSPNRSLRLPQPSHATLIVLVAIVTLVVQREYVQSAS